MVFSIGEGCAAPGASVKPMTSVPPLKNSALPSSEGRVGRGPSSTVSAVVLAMLVDGPLLLVGVFVEGSRSREQPLRKKSAAARERNRFITGPNGLPWCSVSTHAFSLIELRFVFPGILASLLSIIVTVTSSLFGAPTSANVPGVLQATSKVAASDDRVAALWRNGKRECSAGYIGNDWWLTASHCLGRDLRLTQADGDNAKVLASTPVAEKSDVALLKADPMDAEAFELPSRPLRVNDSLFLVGYGGMHTFASEAVVRVEETEVAGEIQGYDFDNLIQSRSMFASRTCNGDSGAPLYQDTVIFAVHTGGEENEECTDGTRRHMWHSEIYPNLQSLRTLMDSYDDFDSPAAFEEAKKHAQTQKKEPKRSSSLSSLSSW